MSINGQNSQVFGCTDSVPQTFRASPPVGSVVEIVSGPRIRLATDSPVTGNTIQSVTGSESEFVESKKPLVIVYGDSIASGFGTETPSRDSWTVLLRRNYEVGVEAWGARQLHSDYVSGLNSLMSNFAFYGQPESIWLAIGVNDCFAGLDPVEFQNEYGALLDAAHARFPLAFIFAQTPLILADETTDHGYAPSAYREAITNVCSTRAFCELVNGTAILSLEDLSDDGVHPTSDGNKKYEAFVLNTLH
jgi:lysophospholipase L1-like esterase